MGNAHPPKGIMSNFFDPWFHNPPTTSERWVARIILTGLVIGLVTIFFL